MDPLDKVDCAFTSARTGTDEYDDAVDHFAGNGKSNYNKSLSFIETKLVNSKILDRNNLNAFCRLQIKCS